MIRSIHDAVQAVEILKEPDSLEFMESVAKVIVQCYQKKGKLIIAGNGGSLCDAMHFAEELTGQFRKKRKPLAAIALSDPGHMSCVANDMGFESVFSRGVGALGKPEDIFFALTTSGNSANLIEAVCVAKEIGLKTVGFLGKSGGELLGTCDFEWVVRGFETSDRIQEAHMAAIHIIIELVEGELFKSLAEVEKVHEKIAQLQL